MYCIKCGVHLSDTEKKCPLCNTVVYHPDIQQKSERELYPIRKLPKISGSVNRFLCGAIAILFMIPIILVFCSDMQFDGNLDWFGYIAGGILVIYLTFAFPMWFRNRNPVIFVPCDFVAVMVYLFYVNLALGDNWFFTFALPITFEIALITSALVTILHYIHRCRLYAVGGFVAAFGIWILTIELMLDITFGVKFIGWSLYPMITFVLLGVLLIYLAMNSEAREKIERKLFF